MQDQLPPQDPMADTRGAFNFFMFALECYGFFAEVFLHVRFGSRYFGLRPAGTLFLLMMHVLYWNGAGAEELTLCMGTFFFLCLWHRLHMLQRRSTGDLDAVHSLYDGFPWMMSAKSKVSELTYKRYHEPAMVMIIGAGGWAVLPPLGSWIFLCGLGLFLSQLAVTMERQQRNQDLQDQCIEMQLRAEEMRKFRR